MDTTDGSVASTIADTSSMTTPLLEVVEVFAAGTCDVCPITWELWYGNRVLAARLTPYIVPPDTTPKRRAAAVTRAVVFA